MLSNKNIHLVAYYAIKPKDPKQTKIAGYLSNPDNLTYDESINITRGLKTRDRLNASVILNLTTQQVVKNTFKSETDFPSLLSYYQEGYPKYINPLLAQLYPEENNGSINVPNEEEKTGS
jgi:hypothetical protein